MAVQTKPAAEKPHEVFDLDAGWKLLQEYSRIPVQDMYNHAENIMEKALQVAPYPCIRRFRFLDLVMVTTDVYPLIIKRLKQGETFLDLACCLGQEIRQLVHDGAPSENTYGSDLYDGFFPLSYELFQDKSSLKTTFVAADIFDDASPLMGLAGKMNIIYVGDFFHLFNLEDQEKIAERIVQLLVAMPGSLVVGRHSGDGIAGEYSRVRDGSGRKHFQHNPHSWKELWDRVGERTGSSWLVNVELVTEFKFRSVDEEVSNEFQRLQGAKGLMYTIERR
ncbi:S-adenosyl-L-methionine-dependent methyltransferase [Pochonia chlamydosporia 170]|uniref:S-adenosyl-L-methionine-dependent methyltransferase n=1 Tax=Pochonia chlamydosporia 170 TaxID=1380566 RepID=A0A179G454_METCM|nr:S-adenosyl-L-methionine-dependent methyltransferase [Pochonia chlamydosporia 170]OAQ72577.1 S-adenosyl-L-methionine-dependent methyltransferase [Pochonia chlamydosporia 170]